MTSNGAFEPIRLPSLRRRLHPGGDFLVQHMGVADCGFDLRVVQRSLDELEIARLAQQFCREIMPQIVEAQIGR
jgi:hypothetical protein